MDVLLFMDLLVQQILRLFQKIWINTNTGAVFGIVFIIVGLAFKISAVPFHMWTPDVYEGSPTSVTSFFALVPKDCRINSFY